MSATLPKGATHYGNIFFSITVTHTQQGCQWHEICYLCPEIIYQVENKLAYWQNKADHDDLLKAIVLPMS